MDVPEETCPYGNHFPLIDPTQSYFGFNLQKKNHLEKEYRLQQGDLSKAADDKAALIKNRAMETYTSVEQKREIEKEQAKSKELQQRLAEADARLKYLEEQQSEEKRNDSDTS